MSAKKNHLAKTTKRLLARHEYTVSPSLLLSVEGGLLIVLAAMATLINVLDHSLVIMGLDVAVISTGLLGSVTALRMRRPNVTMLSLFLITIVAATAHLLWFSHAAILFLGLAALLALVDAIGNIVLIILSRRSRLGV